MTLAHLKTFVAVAEQRHFARAAATRHLSQPAVSHQIALLEGDVGAKLLNRAPRRVSLTLAGEVLLEEARRILAAVDRARERMHEVSSGTVGRIRLGASATPGLYVLPALLAKYRAAHPTFDLDFEIGGVDVIADRVIRNELDMAIIAGRPPTDELRVKPILRDELVAIGAPAAGSRKRPAGGRNRVLDAQHWIMREATSTTRREVDAWLSRHGIVPARIMTFDGPDAVKRAVMAGLGVAIVSRLTVSEDLASGRIVQLDPGLPLPSRDVSIVDHPHKHHGAACSAMLQFLAATFPPLSDVAERRGNPSQSTPTRRTVPPRTPLS